MASARSADELLDVEIPAWPLLKARFADAAVDVKVVPVDDSTSRDVLFRLQVTAASTLGAIASSCEALVLDHGWLRFLGAGTEKIEDLATANGLRDPGQRLVPPGHLVVAYDVLGGVFAINYSDLPGQRGEICYWGPDTLEWTPLGAGHTAFIEWVLNTGVAEFYRDLRWPGWEAEVSGLSIDEGISVYPFLFTAEGRNIAAAARKNVPFRELLDLNDQLAESLRAGSE